MPVPSSAGSPFAPSYKVVLPTPRAGVVSPGVPCVGSRGDALGPACPLLQARVLPAAWKEAFAVPFMVEIKTPDSLGGGGGPFCLKF